MKALKLVVPLVLAILVSGAFSAEEKEHKDKLTGTVSAKPADAKADVVAVLKYKDGDKDKTINLIAEKEAAEKLTKNMDKVVEVLGTKVDDNNFKVVRVKTEKKEGEKKEGEKKPGENK